MTEAYPGSIPFLRLTADLLAGRPLKIHAAKYEKNWSTGQWRCVCSCGESKQGTEHEVKTWGPTHDLNEDVA